MSDSSTVDALLSHYFRPIQALFSLEGVTNIYVNRFDSIQYERYGKTQVFDGGWDNETQLYGTVHTLAQSLQQAIREDEPLLDAVMPDGSRLNAVLPPIVENTVLTIRVFPEKPITGEQLIAWGALSGRMLDYLRFCVLTRQNIIVSGGVNSGKTTLLKIMIDTIPDARRLIVIEDTKELSLGKDTIQMEAPNRTNSFGEKVVTMGRLTINTLRMNPSQVVLGEIRDPEAASAFKTLTNTGHSGVRLPMLTVQKTRLFVYKTWW